MKFNSILCVCTGNICRSPLAAALFRRELPSMDIGSAGIGALVGADVPAPVAEIAQREGLDVAAHRGRQVDSAMLSAHDLVIVMEAEQRQWITANFPQSQGRVFMMTHWSGGEDIADPYRRSPQAYEKAYAQIRDNVAAWARRLAPQQVASQ